MVVVKRTDDTSAWGVLHRSLKASNLELALNTTGAGSSGAQDRFGDGADAKWDSATFTVGAGNNTNGATYVAYLFAHDDSASGIIQCGSYTGNGSSTGPVIDLGWEPQWVMIKRATGGTGEWFISDSARGLSAGSDPFLKANSSDAESTNDYIDPSSSGFQIVVTAADVNNSGDTYVYAAIRAES
jgi:hypothetical protein